MMRRLLKQIQGKNKLFYLALLILLALFVRFVLPELEQDVDLGLLKGNIRCVDGDTFWVDDVKIRLVAIDAPELSGKEPYSYEAKDFACNLLNNADELRFRYDIGNEEDQYGRKLYWIYVDERLLQEALLLEGLAKIRYVDEKTIRPDTYQMIIAAQKIAQKQKLGIWK